MGPLSPEAERAWASLRRHLERSELFTLVFLFSEVAPAFAEVQRRIDERLRAVGGRLEVLRLERASLWRDALASALVEDAAKIEAHVPLWLALDERSADATMDARRGDLLGALNQYRSRLEREFRRPLLVALPTSYLGRVWHVAPDLWTVRGAVVELPAEPAHARTWEPSRSRTLAAEPPGLEAIAEWERLAEIARTDPERVSPFVARAAAEAALARGLLEKAREIAEAGLVLARAQRERGDALERRHNELIALSTLGEVLLERQRQREALAVFEGALGLARRLVGESGETAQGLRDVSVSLDNVGRVLEAQQRLGDAEAAYEEAVALCRKLLALSKEDLWPARMLGTLLASLQRVYRHHGKADLAAKVGAELATLPVESPSE